MVCLLVSEEEEGQRVDEPGDEGQERRNRGRNRGFSEVETQTEAETQIGMGVQTQMELQTPSEMLVCNNETMEREVNTLTNNGNRNKEADVLLDAQRGTHTSDKYSEKVTNVSPGTQKKRLGSETWSDNKLVGFVVPRRVESLTEKCKLALRGIDREAKHEELKENHEGLTGTDGENTFNLQQNTHFACADHSIFPTQNVKDKGQNTENVQLTKFNDINTETECVGLTRPGEQVDGQMGQETVVSVQHVNGKNYNGVQTQRTTLTEDCADQTAILIVDHTQRQENWMGDTNKAGLQHVVELETVLQQVEEEKQGAEMKRMPLLSVDRFFLAGSQVKGT